MPKSSSAGFFFTHFPRDSSAFATTVFSAIATGNKTLPGVGSYWAWHPPESTIPKDYRDRYEALTGCSLRQCPVCHHGCMVTIEILAARRPPSIQDTS